MDTHLDPTQGFINIKSNFPKMENKPKISQNGRASHLDKKQQ